MQPLRPPKSRKPCKHWLSQVVVVIITTTVTTTKTTYRPLSKKINVIKTVSRCIFFLALLCQCVFLIKGSTTTFHNHILKGSSQIICKPYPKFPIGFGISIIIIPAPILIDLIDFPGSTAICDFSFFALTHTLLIKTGNGVIFQTVLF